MTDTLTTMLSKEDFLKHYGVKGQKWGVLRDRAASGSRGAAKKLAKADGAWERELHSTAGWVKVNNHLAEKMNGENGLIAKHNANPKYAKIKDFWDESDPKVQEYQNDYAKLANKEFQKSSVELYGESPSGRYSIRYNQMEDGNAYMEVVDSQMAHADSTIPLRFYLKKDAEGRILGVELNDDNGAIKHERTSMTDTQLTGMLSKDEFLEHMDAMSTMTEDEYLEHFGKKGMKWGVRNGPKLTADGRERKSGKELRALNKASKKTDAAAAAIKRAKDTQLRDKKIDQARSRADANKTALKTAKIQYKSDKHVIGKREAAKAVNKVRSKLLEDAEVANLAKSGKETRQAVMLAISQQVITSAILAR